MDEQTEIYEPFFPDPILYINGVKAENLHFGRYKIKIIEPSQNL